MANASNKSLLASNPLILLPGTLFWAAVAYGIAMDDQFVLGGAVVLAVTTIVTVLIIKGIRSADESAELKRIWLDGSEGTAKIVRVKETGASFNDHPQVDFELEVSPRKGEAFGTSFTTYVRTLAIPRIQPGCEVSVRIDPKDPTRVVIDEELVYPGYR